MQPLPTSPLPAGSVRSSRATRLLALSTLLLAPVILGACRDPKVASYRVPKDAAAEQEAAKAAARASASMMPGGSGTAMPPAGSSGAATGGLQTAQGHDLEWKAPSHWAKKTASSMRKATYAISEGDATADLAVTAFPGDVGGEVANVNRWRGQVGLQPVSEAEALSSVVRLEANGLKIGVVDIVDSSGSTRMLGAWVPFEGATWFFKLLGPDAVVAKEKPAFLEFLKTVKHGGEHTP